jgi:5-methylcytosine-specific restriction endonuclease McrA
LELEHIDGDPTNHELDNLRLICPNCHAQTETYKNRNKGRGRYSRRARYAQGKSF